MNTLPVIYPGMKLEALKSFGDHVTRGKLYQVAKVFKTSDEQITFNVTCCDTGTHCTCVTNENRCWIYHILDGHTWFRFFDDSIITPLTPEDEKRAVSYNKSNLSDLERFLK